ncbi:MAG: DUF1553 domain-containing protein [Bryobacterales bacterium]
MAVFQALAAEPMALANSDRLIDRFVWEKLEADQVPHAPLSSDTEFVRRIYLDLTGRLPTPEQTQAFLSDGSPDKRDRLIDSLFPPMPVPGMRADFNYASLDRWSYFFDALFKSSQVLGEGMNVLHDFVYKSLVLNTPYDAFVREMLTAETISTWSHGAPNMIARWHVYEGDGYQINHEDTCDEITINTSKMFLGVNLECVSCHDGAGHLEKVNLWLSKRKRAELWSQASFFGEMYISPDFGRSPQFVIRDTAKGYDLTTRSALRPPRYKADVAPRFLLDGEAPRKGESLRQAYARILTSRPQFARATVNLFWAELMGEGIVDPPMDFDLARQDPKNPPPAPWTIQPSHPELLDALARAFEESGYDLRWLLTTIAKSKTYQLSAHFDGEWLPRYERHFARRKLRRLAAEQLWDAIADAAGVHREIPVRYDDLKVDRVYKIHSPMDLDSGKNVDLNQVCTEFGMTDRYTSEPSREPSMSQAAILLNHETLLDWVKVRDKGRLRELLDAEPPVPNGKIAEQLYLATLSRLPDEGERRIASEHLAEYRAAGAEDLLWSLFNELEFLFY